MPWAATSTSLTRGRRSIVLHPIFLPTTKVSLIKKYGGEIIQSIALTVLLLNFQAQLQKRFLFLSMCQLNTRLVQNTTTTTEILLSCRILSKNSLE